MYDPWEAPHLRRRQSVFHYHQWAIFILITWDLSPSNLFCFSNYKLVTLKRTSSYLRPISWSLVSPSWVHVSLCSTVELLWLDPALSYLLLYFSPVSVPIDRNGIILHISTYCGQGCGNKHFRQYCHRMYVGRGREDGERVGENSQWDQTNYKVCQHRQTGGVRNRLVNNLAEKGQFRVALESGQSPHRVLVMSEDACVEWHKARFKRAVKWVPSS